MIKFGVYLSWSKLVKVYSPAGKNKKKVTSSLIRFATSTCLVLKQHEVEVGLTAVLFKLP